MNRRKKIKTILTKKEKQANRKNITTKKPRYISKAERETLELAEQTAETSSTADLSPQSK